MFLCRTWGRNNLYSFRFPWLPFYTSERVTAGSPSAPGLAAKAGLPEFSGATCSSRLCGGRENGGRPRMEVRGGGVLPGPRRLPAPGPSPRQPDAEPVGGPGCRALAPRTPCSWRPLWWVSAPGRALSASGCLSHFPSKTFQARRELKRLKEEARRKHAVAVIWAYWLGLKVLPPPPLSGAGSGPRTH